MKESKEKDRKEKKIKTKFTIHNSNITSLLRFLLWRN